MEPAMLWPIYETGRAGYVDRRGRVVIGGLLATRAFREGLGPACDADGWGYVGPDGAFVLRGLTGAGPFEGSLAVADAPTGRGVLRRDGTWLVPPAWDDVVRVAGGFRVHRDGRIGFLDPDGQALFEPRWSEVVGISPLLGVCGPEGWSLLDLRDRRVVSLEVDKVTGTGPDSAAAQAAGGCGILDPDGTWIVAPRYGWAEPFVGDLAPVRLDLGQFGLVDRRGEVVLPLEWLVVRVAATGFWAERDGSGFLLDPRGRRISGPWFERHVGPGVDLVRGEHGWGAVGPDGREIVPPRWSSLHAAGRGRFGAQDPQTSLWGVLGPDGTPIVPFRYRSIGLYEGDLVSADEGRAWVADEGEIWRRTPPREPVVPAWEHPVADWPAAKARLGALAQGPPEWFGASGPSGHAFRLGPARTEAEIDALQARHRVTLPADLRAFLTTVGDGPRTGAFGGAGPGHGLYAIAEALDDGFPGMADPFVPPDPDQRDDRLGYEVPGLLVLGTHGCAFDYAVALAGPFAGTMWTFTGDLWIPDTPAFHAVLSAVEDDYALAHRWILHHLDRVPIRTFADTWLDWLADAERAPRPQA